MPRRRVRRRDCQPRLAADGNPQPLQRPAVRREGRAEQPLRVATGIPEHFEVLQVVQRLLCCCAAAVDPGAAVAAGGGVDGAACLGAADGGRRPVEGQHGIAGLLDRGPDGDAGLWGAGTPWPLGERVD